MSRKKQPQRGYGILSAALAVVLVVLIVVACVMPGPPVEPTQPSTQGTQPTTQPTQPTTEPTSEPTQPPTEPTTEPTQPPVVKVGTATITNTGDMLMHIPVINSAVKDEKGGYDFANVFQYVSGYVQQADLAVANLETTLYGPTWTWYDDNGKHTGYSGYPRFNCPDGIVTSLGAAGFDMLLTANNHTYDTGLEGFDRTQQVIRDAGLTHLGTVSGEEEPLWQVRSIGGIQVGMVCYTYETNEKPDKVSLNFIPLDPSVYDRVGTFHDSEEGRAVLQQEMAENISQMRAAGAEAIVLYIHWGFEYQTKESKNQNIIAQMMCDLGVDVIVGGHPHVVQPMELLTSENDPDHKTVCLYSMGNALSNQNRAAMSSQKTGHTEDGVLFSFTFAKYSDGTVILESAQILPTWVRRHWSNDRGRYLYPIIPLDMAVEDWKTQFGLNDSALQLAKESYQRTMDIVGTGLEEIQTYLSAHQQQVEDLLGVQKVE